MYTLAVHEFCLLQQIKCVCKKLFSIFWLFIEYISFISCIYIHFCVYLQIKLQS